MSTVFQHSLLRFAVLGLSSLFRGVVALMSDSLDDVDLDAS